jgi:hypothetical protein
LNYANRANTNSAPTADADEETTQREGAELDSSVSHKDTTTDSAQDGSSVPSLTTVDVQQNESSLHPTQTDSSTTIQTALQQENQQEQQHQQQQAQSRLEQQQLPSLSSSSQHSSLSQDLLHDGEASNVTASLQPQHHHHQQQQQQKQSSMSVEDLLHELKLRRHELSSLSSTALLAVITVNFN